MSHIREELLSTEEACLALVKQGLAQGVNIDSIGVDRYKRTLLQRSILKNWRSLFTLLLEFNASVNVSDSLRSTPLLNAIHNGSLNMMERLIDRGAHLESWNRGDSPLECAVRLGNVEAARLLLERGCDVDGVRSLHTSPQTSLRCSPVGSATSSVGSSVNMDVEDSSSGLSAGPSPPTTTPTTSTGSQIFLQPASANEESPTSFLQLFFFSDDLNNNNNRTETSPHFTAPAFPFGPPWDEEDTRENRTALSAAIKRRSKNMIDLLLLYGASPHKPLHIAVQNNYTEGVETLLCANAELEVTCDEAEPPPVFTAVEYGAMDSLELLLICGADPNCQYRDLPALLRALTMDNGVTATRLLLRYGAFPNPVLVSDVHPLAAAVATSNPEAVQLLLKSGADPFITTLPLECSVTSLVSRHSRFGDSECSHLVRSAMNRSRMYSFIQGEHPSNRDSTIFSSFFHSRFFEKHIVRVISHYL